MYLSFSVSLCFSVSSVCVSLCLEEEYPHLSKLDELFVKVNRVHNYAYY